MDDASSAWFSSRAPRRAQRRPSTSQGHSDRELTLNSTFNHSDIVPHGGFEPFPDLRRPQDELDSSQQTGGQPVFGAFSDGGPRSAGDRSVSPPSVFDDGGRRPSTEPTTVQESDEPGSYDLKPPPPSVSHQNIETLAGRFFSADHLDLILRDQALAARFTKFLEQYRPQNSAALKQYVESKKALAAIDYANSLAKQIPTSAGEPPYVAATVDEAFEERSSQTVGDLVEEALPSYLTHRLVALVTESLVKEITQNNMPIMRELIPSLAEVYCITDPSLPDNPIVYGSEEFYNVTQYGSEYVIGRNCRFLQGPKTSNASVRRMIEALTAGEEICETILNYRRDGSPFMNLLLIAPLYDHKGQVRYFLGCQIDVSSLIEGGRGLESFSQLLKQDRSESRFGGLQERDPLTLLGELGQMLNEGEAESVKNKMRSNSMSQKTQDSGTSTPMRRHGGRRVLAMDGSSLTGPGSLKALWPDPELGHSGRLPGVYRNYLLVRPYPSLRITFTSPALRIPGLLQTKFMDRVGGPQQLREGILDAFEHGTSVTAKISWLTHPGSNGDSHQNQGVQGKPRWIHCTPLLGSDERVGVWMVVVVENEDITGQLNRHNNGPTESPMNHGSVARTQGNKLYADYLRREGRDRPGTNGSQNTSSSARERREVDDQFRDF